MKIRWMRGIVLAVALLVPGGALAQPAQVLSGEVVVKSDEHHVLIGLDESDSEGNVDGYVDHLFFYITLDWILHPISLRDFAADLEIRPHSLRILTHTERNELDLGLARTRPEPRSKYLEYSFKRFGEGINIYHYSGDVVAHLLLTDLVGMEKEMEELSPKLFRSLLRDKSTEVFEPSDELGVLGPFYVDPDPDTGGAGECRQSCTKSCRGGACSAACQVGFCAKCACLGEGNPPPFPDCQCQLGR